MIASPILIPFICGMIAYFIRNNSARRVLWCGAAAAHLAVSIQIAAMSPHHGSGLWIGSDALSAVFLPLTSLLFLAATVYGIGSLQREKTVRERVSATQRAEAVYTGCMLLFLASMSWVILSRHLGLQWVAVEATTLASAPLIYFHRNRRSLEAAWKYLLICSVGIALALLGVFCVAVAGSGLVRDLSLDGLLSQAPSLNREWLKIAFLFLLVGYGTKMGLAPLHTWLPDAHSESPSPLSMLLSGALLNCAFIGILRIHQVCVAAGMASFGSGLLVVFGLLSAGTAGVFILHQADTKRMLAYSSVEHMGIMALGAGLGATGGYAALLHAVNHSLIKAMLFMAAGNLLWIYRSKIVRDIRGAGVRAPLTGIIWIGGFFAISGMPPFGLFMSEFLILKTALDQGRWIVAGLYITCLLLVFISMAAIILRTALGKPDHLQPDRSAGLACVIPPLAFGALALVLGIYIPGGLNTLLQTAAGLIGG